MGTESSFFFFLKKKKKKKKKKKGTYLYFQIDISDIIILNEA